MHAPGSRLSLATNKYTKDGGEHKHNVPEKRTFWFLSVSVLVNLFHSTRIPRHLRISSLPRQNRRTRL